MMKGKIPLFLFLFTYFIQAQTPDKLSSGEIYAKVQKLNFLGKVLYVAAHPDDENSKLISYFSNYYHAETAYLSLTRGDGGQNLIGSELREKLGAIRTQELLAARKIDGGKQFFTRANDFGYSKNPDETFSIWNKKEVLEDVTAVINNFQPDIIINRFDHRTPGTTHGHHTASAMLCLEAVKNAAIKPKRIFLNTSWFFYGSLEKFEEADKSNLITIDANVYYPLNGKSNSEIAALSRSQHKCQGFGAVGIRGEDAEYLELIQGTAAPEDNLFEGIDTSWQRLKDGAEIEKILKPVETNFNFQNPSVHLPELVKAYQLIQNLSNAHWKIQKTEEIKEIILACSGLFLEALSSTENATSANTISIDLEAINRSYTNVKLLSVSILNDINLEIDTLLKNNAGFKKPVKFTLPEKTPYANLFWLNEKPDIGLYRVTNKNLRNLPELENPYPIIFMLEIEGVKIPVVKNLVYKKNEPGDGETYIPFAVVPKFTAAFSGKVFVFKTGQPKPVQVTVKAFEENAEGMLSLQVPAGWKVEPKEIPVTIAAKNDTKTYTFTITSPIKEENTTISAVIKSGNTAYNQEITQIIYPHIPKQTILEPSEAKLVNLNLTTKQAHVGYVTGAGDEVGKYLESLDYKITYLQPKDINVENLQKFDAIILGIRAFNVLPELQYKNKILFEYAEKGGNVIVQYNTTSNLLTKDIAPFSIDLSRARITDENSPVVFLEPKHPVFNYPNKMTAQDFEGWVQERGLYFAGQWDHRFIPVLALNDKNEEPEKGGLLIAKYGKGNYVYTGLSFFRELPEGVIGAYKLLANLIALE